LTYQVIRQQCNVMSQDKEPPIFLVGCPRSGTTLLQSMLMGHSQIASFPESHLFTKGFGGSFWQRLQKNIYRGYHLYRILQPWLTDTHTLFNLSPPHLQRSWFRASMIRQFCQQLSTWSHEQHKTMWVEKTPMHLDHIHQISHYLPESKFVHIIRDGRAVVASLYDVTRKYPKQWGGERALSDCIKQWNRCMTLSHRYSSQDNHHFVEYEYLVRDPVAVISSLCEFLGVTYQDTMVCNFTQASKQAVLKEEAWKIRNHHQLQSTGLDLYQKLFTTNQKRDIEENLDFKLFKDITIHETSH